jgi:16S rRNA (cytosine967-C5)-methyltransferase
MNSRKLATDIVTQVLRDKAYSNIVVGRELNKASLDEKDKALVTEIVYGTIKYKYTIDAILKSFIKVGFNKLDSFILNLLRISVYQIKYLDKIPPYAAVNEAVNLSKSVSISSSKFVNGVLRNYLRNKDITIKNDDDIKNLALMYSFEEWMVKLFINQYGIETTKAILEGLNETPYNTVRVNTYKIKYEEAFDKLVQLGYNVTDGYICPEAIKIVKGRNIENNEVFKAGFITVQDESAMLVAGLMELDENMTVLDLCSAPGGKTTHIAELMNNTGIVKAFDIHSGKLKLIEDNAKRLGLENIKLSTMDAGGYNKDLRESAHRVLIDVPCSGLGIIRKKPEIKWNKSIRELTEIVNIQRKIITAASQYVKIGGILIYSTCTLNKKENEEVINWFLKNNNNYAIEKIFVGESENLLYHKEGMLTILPNENMDGFFITKLKRLK